MSQAQEYILKAGVQEFLKAHENDDVQNLLLKQKEVLGVPTEWVARQLTGRCKAKLKLPTWYNSPGIIFPQGLSIEQASSEVTAKYKSSVIEAALIEEKKILTGADLTGGLGIDSYFLSRVASHLDYVEPNADLLETTKHNHSTLGARNISYHQTTADQFLLNIGPLDFIYLDPSRRRHSKKVYHFTDCEPDVTLLLDALLDKSSTILIKTSPLLDLHQGFGELRQVSRIYVISVENECKEVLFLLQRGAGGDPLIQAVDLSRIGAVIDSSSFTWSEEKNSTVEFSSPLEFLYEPNAALLKSGAFKWVGQHASVKKLAPNTHLYTNADQKNFPGRIFRITEHVKLDKKLKDRFKNGYANILTRNYPMSVEGIKKKTGLREGGERYLIAAQSEKEKHVMIAERIK